MRWRISWNKSYLIWNEILYKLMLEVQWFNRSRRRFSTRYKLVPISLQTIFSLYCWRKMILMLWLSFTVRLLCGWRNWWRLDKCCTNSLWFKRYDWGFKEMKAEFKWRLSWKPYLLAKRRSCSKGLRWCREDIFGWRCCWYLEGWSGSMQVVRVFSSEVD